MNNELDETTKPIGARFGEAFFCIAYLVFAFVVACIMQSKYSSLPKGIDARPDRLRFGFGFMLAFLLGVGDAFHLIPRIIFNLKGSLKKKNAIFGMGNLISSVTMTIFYNILIKMCDSLEYFGEEYNLWIERAILALTIVRILLLLMPQNMWQLGGANKKWAIIRNTPFVMIGLLSVIGIIRVMQYMQTYPASFYMQIIVAVVLSFLFYMPVAVFAHDRPKLGMLMMPKTICYVWMLSVICFFR